MSEHGVETDAPEWMQFTCACGAIYRTILRDVVCPDCQTLTHVTAERNALPVHLLNEYGTTDCPVERVRAFADGGECSACGARVTPSEASQS